MTWNYRIVDWGNNQFDIREVYYDESGKITGWTANPRELSGATAQDIIDDLELMLESVKKWAVLHYLDLPGTQELEDE